MIDIYVRKCTSTCIKTHVCACSWCQKLRFKNYVQLHHFQGLLIAVDHYLSLVLISFRLCFSGHLIKRYLTETTNLKQHLGLDMDNSGECKIIVINYKHFPKDHGNGCGYEMSKSLLSIKSCYQQKCTRHFILHFRNVFHLLFRRHICM